MLAGRPEPAAEPADPAARRVPRWAARLGPGLGPAPGPRLGPRPGPAPDMKIHLGKNLEEERQILLQQQKICRSRARKYFVESNRRRKAFEEKRKEQEEREYQIREQILQQRKQKFEEVTEKFQRAHIPFSQQRRAVFQKSVPPLEEALKQIQESNLKSEVNLPSSHRPTINWRAVDNALPLSLSKSDHKHQKPLLFDITCDQERKGNSGENLAANKYVFQLKLEETQKLLEDQHLSSLQEFCHEVNQITNSEVLSSVDSLEAGDHEKPYSLLSKEAATSAQKKSVVPESANLQSTNLHKRCFRQDTLSFSKVQHINNWLTNLDAPSLQTGVPFSDILSQPSVLASHESFDSKGENPFDLNRTMEGVTNSADNPVTFVSASPTFVQDNKKKIPSETSNVGAVSSSAAAFRMEKPLVTKSPRLEFQKAWITTDSLLKEMPPFSDHEKYSELTQGNGPTSFVPAANPLLLPSDTQPARLLPKKSGFININTGQCSFKLGKPKDVKKEKQYLHCYKQKLPLFSDIFQAPCIPHNSVANNEQKIAETLSPDVISNSDSGDQHKKIQYSIHERNGIIFLKSILKKESKYEHDYVKALVLNQGFKIGHKKAAAIRDSIELTKEKGDGTETLKTIKKLRWFDETGNSGKNVEGNNSLNRIEFPEACSQTLYTETVSDSAAIVIPGSTISSGDVKKPKDDSVSENVPSLKGFGTAQVSLKCFIPSGYKFAKQAWLASEKEDSPSPAPSGGSRAQRVGPQRGGVKVIRRTRPAKVQAGSMHPNRKGTVIRPQSTCKANMLLQAPSKPFIPHPPSQPPPNIRSGKKFQVFQCQPRMPEETQNIASNCFNPKYSLPTEHKLSQKSDLPFSAVCSELATVMSSQTGYSEGQTLATRNHFIGTQMGTQQNGTFYCTQRCPGGEETQETVTLGTKQHNILDKNGKTADSAAIRGKQKAENKRRILLEQKRQNPRSVEQRFCEQINNFGQTNQLRSNEPKQSRSASHIDQVSESTCEFLMAEHLVKASMAKDQILTVLNNKQEQKPNLSLNETQKFGLCALSAEEQKVLQALDHINKRLHYVQETICKNPSIKNTLKTMPLLNNHPKTNLSPDIGSRLQRKY